MYSFNWIILIADTFDYVYKNIKSDVHLASISGSMISYLVLLLEIHFASISGEIQCKCLGVDVDVFDEHGQSTGIKESLFVKFTPSMQLDFGRIYKIKLIMLTSKIF